jgi:hypothetical protein
MLVTNKQNLPSPLPELAAQSCYMPKEGIYRVTEAIAPPMVRKLVMTKWDSIVVDAEDFLPAHLGTAWHSYLASYKLDGVEQEPRLSMEVDDIILTGGVDWFHRSAEWLNDWKTASTWVWTFGRDEWIGQLNIYAELLRRAGHKVSRLTDTVLFQGWSAAEASRKPPEEYPPRRLMVVDQTLWSSEQTMTFIRSRLQAHAACAPCTEEERWGRGGSWAVKKPGATRAKRVLPTFDEAQRYCLDNNINQNWLEPRPKTYIRCERFCVARSVCPVAMAMLHTDSGDD